MRAFLVAGSPEAEPPAGLRPGPDDYVIAVDSGLLHARDWGWPVHLLIGDLDSLPGSAAAWAATVPAMLTAPAAKDETDLELALARALAGGALQIVICAALGGRPDHMLGNIFLLARPDLAGVDVEIVDGLWSLRALRGGERLMLTGSAGDLVSLLPIGGPATGVVTEHLEYPLCAETLPLGQARGVSNILAGATGAVTLASGLLLVLHQRALAA